MVDFVRRCLWFCAGIDRDIADRVRTERVAMAAVGATVLLTAIMAFLSGSYALYFVFQSKYASLGFGCLWAAIIFNLDRFIVSSIRKQGSMAMECLKAAPRVIISVLISAVIVVPIELILFHSEIERRLPEQALEVQRSYAAALERGPLQASIDASQRGINGIRHELEDLQKRQDDPARAAELDRIEKTVSALDLTIHSVQEQQHAALAAKAEAERKAIDESLGLGASRKPGKGENYQALRAFAAQKQQEAQSLASRLDALGGERGDLTSRRDSLVSKSRIELLHTELRQAEQKMEGLLEQKRNQLQGHAEQVVTQSSGSLLDRLKIAGKLAREDPTADWTATLLRLLFILIELSPILVTLLTGRGPYDAARDAAELEEVRKWDVRRDEAEAAYTNHRRLLYSPPHPTCRPTNGSIPPADEPLSPIRDDNDVPNHPTTIGTIRRN